MATRKQGLPLREPRAKRPDVAETARRVLQEALGETPKTLPRGQRPKKSRGAIIGASVRPSK